MIDTGRCKGLEAVLKIPDASIDLFELDCKNAMIGHLRSIWIDESGHTLDDTTFEPPLWKDVVPDSEQVSLYRIACRRMK